MKRIYGILIVILALSINLISCKSEVTKDVDYTSDNEKNYINPYTGKESETDPNSSVPFMAIIENSKASRPQSGLSYADIVYEISAEGGIPRFISIFHSNYPEKIGPIRSTRKYFITLASEFNLPFAHCGGSSEALNKIKNDPSIMSINEMSNPKYFYRDNSRVAPHNLYTSSEKIIESIHDKNFNPPPKFFLNYSNNTFNDNSLKLSNTIDIKYNNLYSTSYKFKNDRYEKYMDGELAYDDLNGNPLFFDNIVIQKTNITLQSDGNHLNVDLISEGDGYVFSKGKVKEIHWKKDNEYAHTKLYDINGEEIFLTPGTTIWNIVDNSSNIYF